MVDKRISGLEERLKGRGADEIEAIVRREQIDDHELVRLLDVKSRAVGDEIAMFLVNKGLAELVGDALLNGKIRTAQGRIRATWVLQQFGNAYQDASKAYISLLNDRSLDVLSNALFGLVFLLDQSALGAMREAMSNASGERREMLERAEKALREKDPKAYSPGFVDVRGVWRL